MRTPEWCEMVPDGTDTDGTEWNRCTVHDTLAMDGAYVCEDYVPPAYVEGFGSGWFTLVDGEGYLWAYVGETDSWACALNMAYEDDIFSLAAAPISVFQGFDSWEQIVESFGIDGTTTRDRVVALVADLAATLSDPTQAWDIAVADFNHEIDRLSGGEV